MKKNIYSINLIGCFFCFFLISFFSFQSDGYPAASSYYDTVQKIYIGYYQRPADPGGLIYWAGRLDSSGGSLAEIIEAFANSAESQALYGAINSTSIGNVLEEIYQALLGRPADAGGKDYYVAGFNAGRFTAATIMLNLIDGIGPTGVDRTTFDNKLTAANLFTRTIDPELDGLNFQVTYSGDGDNIAGRNFLSLVTSDETTVPNQDGTTTYIQTNIADTGDPITTSTGCNFTSVPLKRELCFGGIGPGCEGALGAPTQKDEKACFVDGWMSVGSILHDKCCVANSNAGYNCNNPWGQIDTGDKSLCSDEWQEAWYNTQCTALGAPRQWHVTSFGPYPAGSIGDNTNEDLRAPDGTRVNPKYQSYCRSGRCEIDAQCNTIKNSDICGEYCTCSSSEYMLSCPDIAGKWNFTNSGTVTCAGGGESMTEYPSGSGTACITQNGCNVSWLAPGTNYSRSGTVIGNSIQVSGIFVVPLAAGLSVTQNTYSASGTISEGTKAMTLNGSGFASGSYEGIPGSCSGTDTATFTR